MLAAAQKPPRGASAHEPSGPPKRVVYVVGQVNRPGGYVLRGSETLTILKALELSGGLNQAAAKNSARIISRREDGSLSEIPVDLNKVIQGKAPDLELRADDVLFIPNARRSPRTKSPFYDPPPTLPFHHNQTG
jgi:protein involved in polysaccharide export with SLBB domain